MDINPSRQGLRAALAEVASSGAGLNAKSLGRYLAKKKGAVSDGLKLVCKYDSNKKINRWHVIDVNACDPTTGDARPGPSEVN